MAINFNGTPAPQSTNSFEALTSMPQSQQAVAAAKPMEPDSIKIGDTEAPKKKGPIHKLKDFIGSVKKFNATIGIYTKSTFKGLFEGALAGSAVFTTGTIVNAIKNRAKNIANTEQIGEAIEEGSKKVAKNLKNTSSKLPKALGVLTGVAVLVANWWNASLNANEAKANIDHRWTKTPTVTK